MVLHLVFLDVAWFEPTARSRVVRLLLASYRRTDPQVDCRWAVRSAWTATAAVEGLIGHVGLRTAQDERRGLLPDNCLITDFVATSRSHDDFCRVRLSAHRVSAAALTIVRGGGHPFGVIEATLQLQV